MPNDNIASSYAVTMINVLQNVITNYESAEATITQTEGELNDLYHEAEFAAPKDMYSGYLIYKDIHDLRVKRREAKEQVELLKDLYEYAKSQSGLGVKSAMQRIQGNAVRIKQQQSQRVYYPRQRNDLTITNQTCTANKPFEELLEKFNAENDGVKSNRKHRR